jgi:hypothetical protein
MDAVSLKEQAWRKAAPGTKVKIWLPGYLGPSLNVTKRQHWAMQGREKQRAFDALSSALLVTAEDSKTGTITTLQSKICWMAYVTLGLYRMMTKKVSRSKSNKRGWNAAWKGRKWK